MTLGDLSIALSPLLALLNPSLLDEQREPLRDVAAVVLDVSPSQRIEDRAERSAAALAEVQRQLRAFPDLDVRVVQAGGATTQSTEEEGTRLFTPLSRALGDVSASRVAGVIVISDGQVHDVPASSQELGLDAPVHLLLSGRADEGDRRLTITEAPSYGLVDKEVSMTVRVDDLPQGQPGQSTSISVTRDGEPFFSTTVELGVDAELPLQLDHAGPTVFEVSVGKGPRELSLANNSAVAVVNGVRDRLRVLLVSGEPHPGERTWRNLLKSDPSVDLVHFTILRPPEKQDGTPINELSLIAFPIRELFEIKLDEFDLIIFDRYRSHGVLPRAYFENIARYVEGGGALLESAGPAFAGPLSLYASPLGRVLPGEPTGDVVEGGFRPTLTDLGRRHPVTAALAGAAAPGETPRWGRWFRQVDAVPRGGVTVMQGLENRPLLVLDHVGQGRVAQLLSDQIWLWSRGYDGGGPQAELLRRVAHWLMKEPELEEEVLQGTVIEGRLEIARRSLGELPTSVEVTKPSGDVLTVPLEPAGDGRATATLPAEEQGLYRIGDGTLRAFAASGPVNPLELSDLRSTAERLQPLVEASGGGIHRLAEGGVPEIRRVRAGRDAAGRDWIGLRSNEDYVVTGIEQVPLVPPLLVLALGLGMLMLAWRREGR